MIRPVGLLCGIGLSVTACNGPAPSALEDCRTLGSASARDECLATWLPDRFRSDPDGAARITEEEITDARVRDFVYLTVTRRVDPGSYRWCDRIQEKVLEERCRVLVSRPHLHRELVGAPPQRFSPTGQGDPAPTSELPQP